MFDRVRCSQCRKVRSYLYPWLGILLRPWYECIPCHLNYCHDCAKSLKARRWTGMRLRFPTRACLRCHRRMPPDSLLANQYD